MIFPHLRSFSTSGHRVTVVSPAQVCQAGDALAIASEELRGDRELVLQAVPRRDAGNGGNDHGNDHGNHG